MNGSIKAVTTDSGASLSTGKDAVYYEATGKQSLKEFQSAFGEVKKAPASSNILLKCAKRQEELILSQVSKMIR